MLPAILGTVAGIGLTVAKDFATEATHDALNTVKKDALERSNKLVKEGLKESEGFFESKANQIKEWLF